ncbi:MAG: hypothetical protein BroJett014_31110 [Planctomycetota bacterium]|nr:hypothetical protein [Planctomycetota bacterium]GIK54138.1 MAG: hypothetical protein BroJett014_31110 [Planctomycetota bacterium]
MDRGIKIAIFVASVISLGLGLIWDQVLSRARDVVADERPDVMGPERIEARVGPKDLQRQELPGDMAEVNTAPAAHKEEATTPQAPVPQPKPAAGGVEEYVVQKGDSWWSIAHTRFKGKGVTTESLQQANPGVSLKPGVKVKVPIKA